MNLMSHSSEKHGPHCPQWLSFVFVMSGSYEFGTILHSHVSMGEMSGSERTPSAGTMWSLNNGIFCSSLLHRLLVFEQYVQKKFSICTRTNARAHIHDAWVVPASPPLWRVEAAKWKAY